MTIKELKNEIELYDENLEVMFSFDYGDHTHTLVAENISNVGTAYVEPSDYHRMDKVLDGDLDSDKIEAGAKEILLLS